nr:ATP-binding cassette domain-containing protein [candidate division Zixibacteria bacterium]NIR66732.1 ATP-binding cassette domain-containing protein [candidate division Zixibacteria bacterium]NIS14980.1 ATP-binding cassette domain-containing protein [candidate division Zixibacteria bacterium]NIS48267.1 ATP-binding cassette domain-containing protein [candidate division Zixibacteria bacterium]NIT51506.1 ATP-binding cassette domain-containing protein [candidate division Zixibacteria bacterium]
KGEVFGLLGPNGAGKTTTLRMLSTAIRPTSGTALIEGADIVKEPQKVRHVTGFLSGNTGLYGRLTAREMVEYFGKLYGMNKGQIIQRTNQIFDMLDMNEFADSRNEKLSTGMKQKVSIARSVLHDPPVMIFDEPTSGLDVMSSRTIVQFIRQCREDNKCLIFSTHIMSEAMRLCDRIAIIHRGKIYFEGTVDEALQKTARDNLEDAFIEIVGV